MQTTCGGKQGKVMSDAILNGKPLSPRENQKTFKVFKQKCSP